MSDQLRDKGKSYHGPPPQCGGCGMTMEYEHGHWACMNVECRWRLRKVQPAVTERAGAER